jgi:hypothetical protein
VERARVREVVTLIHHGLIHFEGSLQGSLETEFPFYLVPSLFHLIFFKIVSNRREKHSNSSKFVALK